MGIKWNLEKQVFEYTPLVTQYPYIGYAPDDRPTYGDEHTAMQKIQDEQDFRLHLLNLLDRVAGSLERIEDIRQELENIQRSAR